MSAQASVFYGVQANTWSLLKAATAHKLVQPQILAINLILHRRAKGTLLIRRRRAKASFMITNAAMIRIPVEIWSLIIGELYPLTLQSVIQLWAKEYADFVTCNWEPHKCDPEDFYDDVKSCFRGETDEFGLLTDCHEFVQEIAEDWAVEFPQEWAEEAEEDCMEEAESIITSRQWDEWTEGEELLNYGCADTWDEDSFASHSAQELQSSNVTYEIGIFLNSLGLKAVSDGSSSKKFSDATILDIFTPVSVKLSSISSISVDATDEGGYTSNLINLSLDTEVANTPFKILFDRYHVEFAPTVDVGHVEEKLEERENVTEQIQKPNPGWKLHCGLWMDS